MIKELKSIESCFFSEDSFEGINGLKDALKKLPEKCFFHVSRDAKNRIKRNSQGVNLEVYGHFKIPDGATDIIIEATRNAGSEASFTYENTHYSVRTSQTG